MDKLSQTIFALCCAAIVIFVIRLIVVTDAEKCGDYEPYRGKDDILMCWCSDNEKAKPGKCR